uniref:AB hydrolase-1 domain-containing protein n=1 Tax=Mucochytrium quahogii TaxID=96639 RepID=A0A7S2S6R3_9STRA|mmetsp:Transcript_3307/g.4785  ORF Transcript_3307/g.4785 Transcript_3307/m.4785 type:complete len:213 (+) Transcript_3307:368-1006(+)
MDIGIDGRLQGRMYAGSGGNAKACVIVTHPHSKLGGDMRNNVVVEMCKGLAEAGYCVICFNFRGVGASKGSSTWSGKAERQDFEAVVAYARQCEGVDKVFLVGYSFGSAVGCGVNENLDGYVAISYPYGRVAGCALGSHYKLADCSLPKLFIVGGNDQFASVPRLETFAKGLQGDTHVQVLEDQDHFWNGTEHMLLPFVLEFLHNAMSPSRI